MAKFREARSPFTRNIGVCLKSAGNFELFYHFLKRDAYFPQKKIKTTDQK